MHKHQFLPLEPTSQWLPNPSQKWAFKVSTNRKKGKGIRLAWKMRVKSAAEQWWGHR
jgi:hypothetical protein